MKKYFVILPVLFLIYFCTLDYSNDEEQTEEIVENPKEEEKIQEVSVSYDGVKLSMTINDYVTQVLACEMPASFNLEALKAGAVAIRTFYLYKSESVNNYVATSGDQCFVDENGMHEKWGNEYSKYYSIIKSAVDETSNEYLSYDGEVIESFYFSLSNGYTENLENVFSEKQTEFVLKRKYINDKIRKKDTKEEFTYEIFKTAYKQYPLMSV